MIKKFLAVVLASTLILASPILAQEGEGADPSAENEQVMQELRDLRQRVQMLENQLREFALARARDQVRDVQADVQEGREPADVARELERIRAGLERAYISAGDFDIDQQALGKQLTTNFDSLIQMVEGGEDASENLEALVSELLVETQRAAQERARQELQALQEDVAAGMRTPEELAAEARRIRAGLERAYTSAGGFEAEAPQLSEDVDASFTSLAEQLEAGEPAAPDFEALMNQLAPSEEEEAAAEQADAAAEEEEAAAEEAPAQEQTSEEAAADFAWQDLGEQVYASSCAVCHQLTGEGIEGAYPALAGNPFVTGAPVPVIELVLNGQGGMPAFGGALTAEEIAAVISHERNAWGNEATIVTPELVAAVNEGEPVEDLLDTLERPGAAN